MEKKLAKGTKDITVSKIYKIIQDKGFIEDLWLDVLSDIKEKPSYVRLKDMVQKLIESSVENYSTKPKDNDERVKTRTIFSELSIMTYTIDTLISETLHKKLKAEFKNIISAIVDDLKTEKIVLEDEKKEKSLSIFEDIGDMLCNGNKKNSNIAGSDDDDSISIYNDSDGRSEVSSVHTSDLSSFEDNISISSEDEDGVVTKKHVPLKLANDLYNKGEITELLDNEKSKTQNKEKVKPKSTTSSNEDISSKKLPPRKRKPNLRYSSSDVVCPLKTFLPQIDSVSSDEIEIGPPLSIRNRRENKKRKASPLKVKSPLKVYDFERFKEIMSPNANSAKRLNVSNNLPFATDYSAQQHEVIQPHESDANAEIMKSLLQNGIEIKRKRGRPSKSSFASDDLKETDLNTFNKQLGDTQDEDNLEQNTEVKRRGRPRKNTFTKNQEQMRLDSPPRDQVELNEKRGRPSNNTSAAHRFSLNYDETVTSKILALNASRSIIKTNLPPKKMNSETETEKSTLSKTKLANQVLLAMRDPNAKHSVESFSILEEQLFQKDKRTSPPSPSKNSKCYEKSDLYKPRSDFRVFNSKGSKAFTLFSN